MTIDANALDSTSVIEVVVQFEASHAGL
jgi:hypothetical protein